MSYDYDSDEEYYNKYYKCDESKIKSDFKSFADPKVKKIKVEGMEKMGKVLGIDIYTDIFITYFFYKIIISLTIFLSTKISPRTCCYKSTWTYSDV